MACGVGEGLDVGLQSLGAYIVGEAYYGVFFPLSSRFGVANELLGGPVMAALYVIRDTNNTPSGYCFLQSVVLFNIFYVVFWSLTLLLVSIYMSFSEQLFD